MFGNYPKVVIIILNWNHTNLTIDCLRSLKKINYSNYRIVVIDNHSEKNQLDILNSFIDHDTILIENDKNYGFAEGNNIGLRIAIKENAEFCCLLNNDTIVEKNFLNELVNVIIQNKKVGMVAPRILNIKKTNEVDNLGILLTKSGLPFNRKAEQNKLFCPSGATALYRVTMLKETVINDNYFDPDYFAYSEDFDLGFRALLAGYIPAYSPKSIIYHYGSATSKDIDDFHLFHHQRNIILTIIKNYPINLLLKYFFLISLVQCALVLMYIRRKKINLILRIYLSALKLLPNMLKKRRYIQKTIKRKEVNISEYIEPIILLRNRH